MDNKNKYYKYVESYNDFPKPGVIFWDFTPLLEDPQAFSKAIEDIINHYANKHITKIVGIESKGFIIAAAIAHRMKKPLILIRKKGLIPGEVYTESFNKEYGVGEYQIKKGIIRQTDNVLIIYDILAGPGASKAAIRLVEQNQAKIVGCAFIIELEYLHGREELEKHNIYSLVQIKEKRRKND